MSEKTAYIKPGFKYWPASELDAIEAKMSGGGGGWGSGSLLYKWEDDWTVESSNENAARDIAVITGVIVLIATRSLPLSVQVTATVAGSIATYYYTNGIETVWYTRRIRHLYVLDGYTGSGFAVWSYCGLATKTKYYANAARSVLVDDIVCNDIPDDASYMLNMLAW